MNVRRVIWFGVSALAIASWIAAASTSGVRQPSVIVPAPKTAPLDRSAAVMQSEVARLHERIAPAAIPSRSRDLFRFAARPRRSPLPVATQPPVTAVAASPVVTPRPALKLIGIAEDAQADGTVRTAIISGPGDVFLVKAGDTIGSQYRVELVSADAVQLVNTTTSSSTTLALH